MLGIMTLIHMGKVRSKLREEDTNPRNVRLSRWQGQQTIEMKKPPLPPCQGNVSKDSLMFGITTAEDQSPLLLCLHTRNNNQTASVERSELTLPVTADQTFKVLSSDPLTMRLPQNCRHVITWSSCPFSTCKKNVHITFMALHHRL